MKSEKNSVRTRARPLSADDWTRMRREGPSALAWMRDGGLADARSRALALVWAGGMPFAGYAWLGWTPLLMLAWLLIDCANTLIADSARLALAGPALKVAHRKDQQCTEMLGLASDLAEGMHRSSATAQRTSPQMLYFFGCVATLFMFAFMLPGAPHLGIGQWRELLADPFIPWLALADLVLQTGRAAYAGMVARGGKRGSNQRIFVESGSNVLLYVGVLMLIWLPINFGALGMVLMLAAINLVRFGFGLYAWWYMPVAMRELATQLERALGAGSAHPGGDSGDLSRTPATGCGN
ncbi:MAG: hypothetical protein HYS20_14140 [Rhodocyclales bacterium]|nr:hypothetical protein [Rhodocyclales bacterium]